MTSNDIPRILIIKGSSQYDAARCFCDEVQQGFLNLGCLVTMLDLTTFPDVSNPMLFEEYNMVFSFDIAGIELYNTMQVKPFFWTFLIDPPIYLNERLKQIDENVMVSCIDKHHVLYLDRYYKNIPWVCFMPHGGATNEIPTFIPYNERKYNVIFMGSLNKLDGINAVIDSLKKDYDPLVSTVIDAALSSPDSYLDTIVSNVLHDSGISFEDNMFREFMYIIRAIDSLRRYHKRCNLIKELANNGISLDIWGSGWEELSSLKSCKDHIRLHGEVNFGEVKYIMSNSKILINDMPPYLEGSHERVFTAMQCGTVVASDKSTYLEECFIDNNDMIFYNPADIKTLAARIRSLLGNPTKALNIIENSLQSSADQTWSMRSAAMLNIMNSLPSA